LTGDAFLNQPAAGAGRASQAGAPPPLLDQGFDSGTLYRLRATVQAHADQAGLSEDRANDVVLAVHELAANAIAHGAGHGRLRLWDLNGSLTCEIVDSGRPDTTATVDSADPWPAANGHGLWLVGQVADHLDLRCGPRGTRAVITFALPLRAVGPPIDNPGPPRGSGPGLGG
jgi:anti-sigma regulatory factor (Ser/Thr protein kinase)